VLSVCFCVCVVVAIVVGLNTFENLIPLKKSCLQWQAKQNGIDKKSSKQSFL
jgi:hypothetical protein